MKKLLCAFVLVLITMSPTLVFADRTFGAGIKIISIELIAGSARSARSSQGAKRTAIIAGFQSDIKRALREHRGATVTILQSSGEFFTHITAVIKY